ncbi:Serine hydroxymethyltransferase 3, chloroplastic [Thelohanellus kitauei]|uniref:glycine hydroxymethyltransferase n=1 Tax=Thelohanellus kitauei TaxID=669202 RepID=A0A0C2N2C6_THEKT|nr:Serine hydroxymethyltransferase 3, chloroplastic [Thelohanellus kitauei]
MPAFHDFMHKNLSETDKELHEMIQSEHRRQKRGLELIASENFTSVPVLQCLGSCLTNKYSEGRPGNRYYGGTEIIDQIELLCQTRALETFKLDENMWGVNVQPYSGSPANFAVYTALLNPHDRIMGMNLPDGGHLSHGFMTKTKRVSATSIFWESLSYGIDQETGLIDYDQIKKLAQIFFPKIIIAGFSCYPRHLDFKKFREICDEVGALLMADISHISGIVSTGLTNNPFEYAHVVTTTSHKLLRGPRSGMIFYRKDSGANYSNLETKINSAVFPGLQGGPHNNVIAGLATALKQANTPEFERYIKAVLENCRSMQQRLSELGYEMATGGSDNHLILINLKNKGLTGGIAEKALELVNISVNKNACPKDSSVLNPSGIRIGTPALTTRGLAAQDMIHVIDLMDECLQLTSSICCQKSIKTAKDFKKLIEDPTIVAQFDVLKNKVDSFSEAFPFPGEL